MTHDPVPPRNVTPRAAASWRALAASSDRRSLSRNAAQSCSRSVPCGGVPPPGPGAGVIFPPLLCRRGRGPAAGNWTVERAPALRRGPRSDVAVAVAGAAVVVGVLVTAVALRDGIGGLGGRDGGWRGD